MDGVQTAPKISERLPEIPPKVSLHNSWVQLAVKERNFLAVVAVGFFACGATYDMPHVAMWVGFALAGYAAVANDSIQTIGTFIASNKSKPWWFLWLFIGGIFLVTMTYGWMTHAGDVSYGRLLSKGFESQPQQFAFLQVAAPLFLIIITRLRMPVSTTFLLLSCFAATAASIQKVLLKSISGYFIAFAGAIVLWLTLGRWMQRRFQGEAHSLWRAAQWGTTGLLWSIWLMQDAANIAVYLPRSLGTWEFVAFSAVIFFGLGILFRMGGERIQEIVDEKSDLVDVRAATVIDLLYAGILYYFKILSAVPMSTTWVFLGLLAGRELAMTLRKTSSENRTVRQTARLIGRDAGYAMAGLLISLGLAASINPVVREAILASL
jgi:hypothetical protein